MGGSAYTEAGNGSQVFRNRSMVRREDLLAKAVESAGDIIEISDRSLVPLCVNPAFTETFGYTPDETLGQP